MKIKRNINGLEVEIELTEEEIRQAGYEHEGEVYREDIISKIKDLKIPMPSDEKIGTLVRMFDNALGNNDYFWDAYWETCRAVLKDGGFLNAFSECDNIKAILAHPENFADKDEYLVLARTADDVVITLGINDAGVFCFRVEDEYTWEDTYPEDGESLQDAYKRILKNCQPKE